MRRPLTALPVLVLVLAAACGPQRPPPLAPETLLAVGVDPGAECDAERATLARDGLRETTRVTGPGVCAVGLASPDGKRTAVRVATARGIVLSRDGDDDAVPAAPRVTLLPPPAGSPPSREVLLGRRDAARARTCISVARVLPDDTAQLVDVHTVELVRRVPTARDLCIEALRDVDGDGRLDAVVVVRLDALAQGTTPAVDVPLSAQGDALAPSLGVAAYWQAERDTRTTALARARAALDVRTAYRLAVELGTIALLAGDGRDGAVRAYDDAMRGLVLDEAEAGFVDAARDAFTRALAPP